jgi:dTDP-4-dehydrorhamnose reductase
MKIVVVGGNGQLGTDVVRAFAENGDDAKGLTHEDIELADLDSVAKCVRELRPDLIVNTAAMHHVETCEREPEKSFAVNALGTRNLAMVARDAQATLMHVSTDYVFDGSKQAPYVEEDAPLPLNVYGCSKLAGEHFVRTLAPKHFVLRTSAIYGKQPCRAKGGLNFVELMLKLARERGEVRVVDSEFVTPTPTSQLAQQIVALSRCESYGLYHATAEGSCSWFEFAKEIFAVTGTPVKLTPAKAGDFPVRVPRPNYSVLENQALKSGGLNIFEPWQSGLRDYLGISKEATHASAAH